MAGPSKAKRSRSAALEDSQCLILFPGWTLISRMRSINVTLSHWLISAAAEQLEPKLNPRGDYVGVESRVWMSLARVGFRSSQASRTSSWICRPQLTAPYDAGADSMRIDYNREPDPTRRRGVWPRGPMTY